MSASKVRVLGIVVLFFTAMSGLSGVSARPSVAAGSSDVGITTLGLSGWEVQSSAIATQSGSVISTPGFSTSGFMNVAPDDAGAPGTELEALVQNGSCPNVFFSTNMKTCFGYMSAIGPDKIKQFQVPWWWRTDFTGALQPGQDATLIINGVVGQADVWVNGQEVATQATVQGDYTRYSFDITSLMRSGDNALAIEVYPNDPTSMYTLDNVDWTQIPPDNNTGIQFPVQLHLSNALGLSNVHVLQNDASDMSSAALTVKADVTNHSAVSQTGTVSAAITPPGGTSSITVSQPVTVPANTTQTVSFQPSAYPTLTISNPQVWWPYQMGSQPLYTLSATLTQGSLTPETASETFGIRAITTSLVGASTMTPNGVRVFAVNGRRFIFRGGGWSENLFLHYSAQDTANQILLMKSMGINGIRTEGKQMPDDFYEQMDRAGIMIDAGFQCCDFWETTSGLTQQNLNVYQLSALTIGQNLRTHPSVINFSWSDNAPSSQQEQAALAGFQQSDFYPENPLISSAEYKTDAQGTLGPSGEKEGPYDWVPPNYWYDTSHYTTRDSSLTNAGGSWGFDSEESAGDTVPTMDSIQRFLSASDQANLWQNFTYNQYHTNYESGTRGYAFGTLDNFDTALQSRYGSWSSLAQYVEEAQVQNYENTRAQFEAFIDHWNNATPSTGTVYWQMNKGWPSMLWTLYNDDYDEAGSYFGAKKANESLHVLYALDNNTVTVDNMGASTQSGLSVTSRVYDLNGTLLDQQTASNLSAASQGVLNGVLAPKVPVGGSSAQTYFVELTLAQNGVTVDRNVYWLSTQQDAVNWNKTLGKPQATMSQYADLTALQHLPTAAVTVTASSSSGTTTVTITNKSSTPTVAFFLRADVRRGNANGSEQTGDNEILPIIWSDNDITLWPGESQTLTATYDPSLLQGATPVVSIQGWNVPRFDVAAG